MAIIKLKKKKPLSINPSKPILDKLTLLINRVYFEDAKQFEAAAIQLVKAGLLKTENQKAKGYGRAYSIPDLSGQGKAYLFLRPKNATQAGIRAEFNPNKLGPSVTESIVEFICMNFLDGDWSDFTQRAVVSRIDVAIDIFDLQISQAHFRVSDAKFHQSYHGTGQRKQTEIFRSPGRKRLSVYDKAAEQIQKGAKDVPEVWTRVESNVVKCGYLKNLAKLKNPLLTFSMTSLSKPPDVDTDFWKIFCIAADATTSASTLGLLSPMLGKKIKAHQAKNTIIGWDAAKLWENWPETVEKSGLLEFLKNLEQDAA